MRKISGYREKRKCDIISALIIFILIAGVRIIISLFTLPLGTISDHTSLYSIAANLAGYNWKDVISNAGCYGIGFFFIFFPLFKIGLSPVTIQIIMNLVIGVVVGIGAVIVYCIVNRNYKKMTKLEKVSLSLIGGSSLIVNSYAPEGGNDFILTICNLLIFYLIMELLREKRNYIKDNIFLLLVMGYSLTIHTRALLMYICFAIAAIIYYLLEKKIIVYYWFWLAYIVEYFAIKLLLNTYRYTIWSGNIRNNSLTSDVMASTATFQFDWYTVKAIMNTGIGIILTETSLTGGTFMLAIGAIGTWGYYAWKKKKYIDNKILFPVLYSIIGFFSLSFGLGVSWLKNIYMGLSSGTLDWFDGYRAFTYCRYAAPFVPIIIILGFNIIIMYKTLYMKIYMLTVIATVVSLSYFIKNVLPYVQNRTERFFFIRMMIDSTVPTDINMWYGSLLAILSPIVLFIFFFLKKKKERLIIYALLITLYVNFERYEIFTNISKNTEITNYNKANAGFELLSSIHDDLEDKDVYVFDTRDITDGQIWYMYQFLNYDMHIIPALPKEIKEECIIFTNGIIDSRYVEGTEYFQLDKNEYVYYRGEKYFNILKKSGAIK